MASDSRNPRDPAALDAESEHHLGLRLKLWLACIVTGAVTGGGSLWVLGTRVRPGATDPGELLAWFAGVAFASVLAGIGLALWLDHHVIGHLRGLLRGLRTGRVSELRGLPSVTGWGELSELGERTQDLLSRQRHNARATDDLELLRAQLALLDAAVARWLATEVWEAPAIEGGPLGETAAALGRGFARRAVVDDQNRTVSRQVAAELVASLADAQESAEQAERGFVEATAMLTTVRELQRLSGELHNALVVVGTATAPPADDGTREALEELVRASQASVAAIGDGMLRVQGVSELVNQLANRATLVAIHAVSAPRRDAGEEDLSRELKLLVTEVRDATERTAQFAVEIEAAVAAAGETMREARERAAARLEARVSATPAAGTRAYDDATRLLERVREMVQDAARKGERLSAAGERASRAAERLSRRVNEETSEAEALALRLAPPGEAPAAAAPARALRLVEEAAAAAAYDDDERPASPGAHGEERS